MAMRSPRKLQSGVTNRLNASEKVAAHARVPPSDEVLNT